MMLDFPITIDPEDLAKLRKAESILRGDYALGAPVAQPVIEAAPLLAPSEDLPGVRTLSGIPRRDWDWLDYPRVPFGAVTELIGDAMAGKGMFAFELAARVTRGAGSIDGSGQYPASDVLILSAEEDPERTITKRLDSLGAVSERVHVVEAELLMPKGADRLKEYIEYYGARLVIVDGLFDYLEPSISPINTVHMRNVMKGYKRVAEETQSAILVIRHIGQGKRQSVMQLGNNSNAITAVVRSTLLIARHPSEPGMRVVAHAKQSNSARADSLMFSIESSETDELAPVVEWHGPTELNAEDLLPWNIRKETRPESSERPEVSFIRKFLMERGGQAEVKDCINALQEAGFTQYKSGSGDTPKRLRELAGITTRRSGFPAKGYWSLT